MDISQVKGTVVATRKDPKLSGHKMLLVELADIAGKSRGGTPMVALDTIDAGIGDLVLLVRGSSARQAMNMSATPVDAIIIGIIDNIECDGDLTYTTST